jgi:xylulokinase
MTHQKAFLLGIDIGTTGTKCAIYDLKGEVVAHAYQEYPMIHPQPSWTEQDPRRWWDAVQRNLKDCFKTQGIDSSRIASIGLSCTNAMTLVDKDGEPVYNAIGHHDKRADPQVAWLREHVGEELVLHVTADKLDKGSFCLPSLRWIIDNRPELAARAHKMLMPSGYIIYKLTGKFSMNRPRMSLTSLADIRTGEWSREIAEKAGIPFSLLPTPYDPCDIVGGVTEEAARLTGLKAGTPVSAGCLDSVAATLGAGAVNEGDVALTIGSSGRICYIGREPIYDKRLLNCRSPYQGLYTILQSTDNAGISLRWFRDVFGAAVEQKAKDAGLSVYDYMNTLAEKVPAGCNGLIYLPYLAGEKSPIWDSNARGVFFGMSLSTDYGAFVRAVMEGVALSIRDCLEIMPVAKAASSPIPLGGGAANSPVWCQIFADVLNRPIVRLKSCETETLGDFIIAAGSIGFSEIGPDFGKKVTAESEVLFPDPAAVSIYEHSYKKYKAVYEHTKALFA